MGRVDVDSIRNVHIFVNGGLTDKPRSRWITINLGKCKFVEKLP
jgi:hypothetical protein